MIHVYIVINSLCTNIYFSLIWIGSCLCMVCIVLSDDNAETCRSRVKDSTHKLRNSAFADVTQVSYLSYMVYSQYYQFTTLHNCSNFLFLLMIQAKYCLFMNFINSNSSLQQAPVGCLESLYGAHSTLWEPMIKVQTAKHSNNKCKQDTMCTELLGILWPQESQLRVVWYNTPDPTFPHIHNSSTRLWRIEVYYSSYLNYP